MTVQDKGYEKIGDIIERYAIYDFDQRLINHLMNECCYFLADKKINPNIFKHFTIEFDIKSDQTYVDIRGGNLMSALWLINVFPPSPEKFISENVCIFDGKKYIYDPRGKSLKIRKYATKQH